MILTTAKEEKVAVSSFFDDALHQVKKFKECSVSISYSQTHLGSPINLQARVELEPDVTDDPNPDEYELYAELEWEDDCPYEIWSQYHYQY